MRERTQAMEEKTRVSQPLRRWQAHTERNDDYAKIRRITREASERHVVIGHATAGGDQRRLRGIPAIARGVTGAINGTAP